VSIRLWVAAAAIFASALSSASGQVGETAQCLVKTRPSTLDYLALASMADSQRPLAMAAYRPQRLELPPADLPQAELSGSLSLH
jgi:hypothetical protein